MPIEDEMETPASAPLVPVTFDADHACGGAHRMSGYRTATPGLVVFRDGPGSGDCGFHAPDDEWNIWHLAEPGVVVGGFDTPEAAMHCAGQLGRFRDREPRWPIDHHRDWLPPAPAPDPPALDVVPGIDDDGGF